jgi:hypothetical protein
MKWLWIAAGAAALCVGFSLAVRGCDDRDAPVVDKTSAPRAPMAKPRTVRRRAVVDESSTAARTDEDAAREAHLAAAFELKRRITEQSALRTAQGANESLKLLDELDALCRDESDRAAVDFKALRAATVEARDAYFRAELPRRLFAAMDRLIEKRVRESSLAPGPDTFAAARQWLGREFDTVLWEDVASDLGLLNKDEIEKFWKDRDRTGRRTATYGTGSFVVCKPKWPADSAKRPGEAASSAAGETWWAAADSGGRAAWLTAQFVESAGRFDVLGTPEVPCDTCGGTGCVSSTDADAQEGRIVCPRCSDCGVVRSVSYH